MCILKNKKFSSFFLFIFLVGIINNIHGRNAFNNIKSFFQTRYDYPSKLSFIERASADTTLALLVHYLYKITGGGLYQFPITIPLAFNNASKGDKTISFWQRFKTSFSKANIIPYSFWISTGILASLILMKKMVIEQKSLIAPIFPVFATFYSVSKIREHLLNKPPLVKNLNTAIFKVFLGSLLSNAILAQIRPAINNYKEEKEKKENQKIEEIIIKIQEYYNTNNSFNNIEKEDFLKDIKKLKHKNTILLISLLKKIGKKAFEEFISIPTYKKFTGKYLDPSYIKKALKDEFGNNNNKDFIKAFFMLKTSFKYKDLSEEPLGIFKGVFFAESGKFKNTIKSEYIYSMLDNIISKTIEMQYKTKDENLKIIEGIFNTIINFDGEKSIKEAFINQGVLEEQDFEGEKSIAYPKIIEKIHDNLDMMMGGMAINLDLTALTMEENNKFAPLMEAELLLAMYKDIL